MQQLNELEINSSLDGATHIRVGPNALTNLGRLLSNGSPLSFELGSYGQFRTLENAWVFFRGGASNERAKQARGKEFETMRQREPMRRVQQEDWFRHHILLCLRAKVTQNPQLMDLLLLSHHNAHLPFVRYYYENHGYGRELVVVREQVWFLDGIVALRDELGRNLQLKPLEA